MDKCQSCTRADKTDTMEGVVATCPSSSGCTLREKGVFKVMFCGWVEGMIDIVAVDPFEARQKVIDHVSEHQAAVLAKHPVAWYAGHVERLT